MTWQLVLESPERGRMVLAWHLVAPVPGWRNLRGAHRRLLDFVSADSPNIVEVRTFPTRDGAMRSARGRAWSLRRYGPDAALIVECVGEDGATRSREPVATRTHSPADGEARP